MHKTPSATPALKIATLSLALALPACKTAPVVSGCSSLAEGVLTTKTPHAQLGQSGDPALDWQLYGVAETGQLNRANDDKATGFAIIQGCERRDAEVRREIERPWWGVW